MKDLWAALTLLVVDTELWREVERAAAFEPNPDFGKGLDQANPKIQGLRPAVQPSLRALHDIDASFRRRGAFLGVYALAEINRWVLDGGKDFGTALERFREEIGKSGVTMSPTNSALLEAVGVLVSDPRFRSQFGSNKANLRDNGFDITAEEEAALRRSFVPESAVAEFAQQIFQIGWSGSCLSAYFIHEGYFHPNM